jgi:hypothetical protein
MEQADPDVAHLENVVGVVLHEIVLADAGGSHDPWRLVSLDMDRHRDALQQIRHTGDDVAAEEVPPDVVGVVMGGEGADEMHAIGFEQVDEFARGVGGIDGNCFAGLLVTDEVDEVDHLAGDPIAHGDVATGEKLAEVEAVGRIGRRRIVLGMLSHH